SRGFGYVTMAEDADAIAAIEALNGKKIDGSTIKVDRAQ
ncbi:MAG: RNA recognition motif-containing protein, partial [Myxococcota bacterium]